MILTALIFLATALLGGWAFVLLGQRSMDNLPIILSFEVLSLACASCTLCLGV